jgi:phosphoribosylglycinamide formyltransferase-1
MKQGPLKIAVLISGTGSNLKALIDARDSGRLEVDIAHVISNKPDAGGLQHARSAGIACSVFPSAGAESRAALDRSIIHCLDEVRPGLVVLAGYMRILGAELVNRFEGKIINLHPSLLPLYPGLDTYRRALEAGDREHGSSVHFVTEGLDDGPLIAQVRIPVHPGDNPAALAKRLGPQEHRLIVASVELFTRHRVEQSPDGVLLNGALLTRPLLLNEHDQLL